MSDEAAFEYLKAHELMFLGTASKSGNPHVSPMFYACDGKQDLLLRASRIGDRPVAEGEPDRRDRGVGDAVRVVEGDRSADRGPGHRTRRRRRDPRG